jgi:hypothetical protein
MSCNLCESRSFNTLNAQVRDVPDFKILECAHCGFVYLSSLEHIQSGFYEESGMHGIEPAPMETSLKDTELDDQRRFDMLKTMRTNKKIVGFRLWSGRFFK